MESEELNSLIETFKKFDGIIILETNLEPTWITFDAKSETNLAIISSQISELKDQYGCSLLALNNSYQLFFELDNENIAVMILNKKLQTILESSPRQAKMKELGLPDLALVTLRQIAVELKQRHNLTFALIWIENNERDNIAIEGSGSPTQLVGLLSRGTHMAIEWADKNIKFYHPKDE